MRSVAIRQKINPLSFCVRFQHFIIEHEAQEGWLANKCTSEAKLNILEKSTSITQRVKRP
ncbi:hypothetical protein T09_15428 [Trichinella sp. T9]|nr:hypothetical protein T09_15428 [Trichinella sp. T9]